MKLHRLRGVLRRFEQSPIPFDLSPRQAQMLSYLTGLSPVGGFIEVPLSVMMNDLGFGTKQTYYRVLNKLIEGRFVRRITCGGNQCTGILVVLKRLEDARVEKRAA